MALARRARPTRRPDSPLNAPQANTLPAKLLDSIILGDCLEVLRALPDACVDAIVTDPPAGISFMGKRWDSDHGGRAQWCAAMTAIFAEALRVLKPGGHALVWALPRTSHWTATALEDAGFEVRDCVTHLFGSGFPKSLDVSKAIDKAAGAQREVVGRYQPPNGMTWNLNNERARDGEIWESLPKRDLRVTTPATDAARQWDGWGTALKPAAEFWWLCRKPLSEPTVAANVLRWGVGALHIGATRVGSEATLRTSNARTNGDGWGMGKHAHVTGSEQGRWPANLVLSHAPSCGPQGCELWCPVRELDAQSGVSSVPRPYVQRTRKRSAIGINVAVEGRITPHYGDTGGASRYFSTFRYVAKASRRERNAGLVAMSAKPSARNGRMAGTPEHGAKHDTPEANNHPTVKSLALMSWLITLITPAGGVILDPFAGSGSTLVAAKAGGWRYIGIEREVEYVAIAEARLGAHI